MTSIVQIRIHASTNKLIRANFYAISWCGFMPYTIMQLENLQRSIQTNSSLIGQFFRHIRKSHLLFQSETSKNILTEIFIASAQQQMAAEFFKNSSNSSLIGQFFRHIKPNHLFSNQNSNLKISASSNWTSQLHLGKFAEECFRNSSKKNYRKNRWICLQTRASSASFSVILGKVI